MIEVRIIEVALDAYVHTHCTCVVSLKCILLAGLVVEACIAALLSYNRQEQEKQQLKLTGI